MADDLAALLDEWRKKPTPELADRIDAVSAAAVAKYKPPKVAPEALPDDAKPYERTRANARALVDEWIDVSEEEIASGLRCFIDGHHMLCEGAAAVAIAGLLKARRADIRDKNVTVVVCGANISSQTLQEALASNEHLSRS